MRLPRVWFGSYFCTFFRTFVSRSVRVPEDPLAVFASLSPVAVVTGTIFECVDTFAVPKSVAISADVYVAIRQQSLPATVSLVVLVPLTFVHLRLFAEKRLARMITTTMTTFTPTLRRIAFIKINAQLYHTWCWRNCSSKKDVITDMAIQLFYITPSGRSSASPRPSGRSVARGLSILHSVTRTAQLPATTSISLLDRLLIDFTHVVNCPFTEASTFWKNNVIYLRDGE